MAVVFDTESVQPADRVEAFLAATRERTGLATLSIPDPGAAISGRYEAWSIGGIWLGRITSTGLTVRRSAAEVRRGDEIGAVTVTMQAAGASRVEQRGSHDLPEGRCILYDPDAPYVGDLQNPGSMLSVRIPRSQLNVPPDIIERAVGGLYRSPLHSLLSRQIGLLAAQADRYAADLGAGELARGFIALVNAVVASATDTDPYAAVPDGTAVDSTIMVGQVVDYINRHLTDPDLHVSTIAAAHFVSVRYLYRLLAAAGIRLEQHIIAARLAYARELLAAPGVENKSVSTIAHMCGFRDPSHFSRRFREANGISPGGWRKAALIHAANG
ncbi:AraC family transcriptional regulator [Nocardia tengchongensis]|uniref:AraC family transcriptional regulator n=1 Tax=Nocardia tengchongensis TaxID=2055889 RepID=UPI0036139AEF